MENQALAMRESAAADGEPLALQVRGLVKRYGKLVAVGGIDFDVATGSCLAVLGPNGAGKTTAVEILVGLKQADRGDVHILGKTWKRDARAIRSLIGVQLQETNHFDKLTPYEVVRMSRSFYAEGSSVDSALDRVELGEKRNARVSDLSSGQKQRLSLACALVSRPRLMFLDEPTTGLDPQARRRAWEIIEEFKHGGGTVVLTTHYMEEAERLADDLIVVDRGKVIARGAPAKLIASLGAEAVIELTLADEQEALRARDVLRSLHTVGEVKHRDHTLRLTASDVQHTLQRVLSALEAAGIRANDLGTHRPTLEDVFVDLTGKHLRED